MPASVLALSRYPRGMPVPQWLNGWQRLSKVDANNLADPLAEPDIERVRRYRKRAVPRDRVASLEVHDYEVAHWGSVEIAAINSDPVRVPRLCKFSHTCRCLATEADIRIALAWRERRGRERQTLATGLARLVVAQDQLGRWPGRRLGEVDAGDLLEFLEDPLVQRCPGRQHRTERFAEAGRSLAVLDEDA